MKTRLLILFIGAVMALTGSAQSQAQEPVQEPDDSIYFYRSWQEMFYLESSGMAVNLTIEPYTPFEIGIYSGDERMDYLFEKEYLAASLGDSIWLINSNLLKRDFGGDAKKLKEYVPLFFNDKVAYVIYVGYGNIPVSKLIFGPEEVSDEEYRYYSEYYYIDFANRKVLKVTPEVLSSLLEDYHDLQMRYEGMKDYKKQYIIEEFFLKYVTRASQDPLRPYILDQVDSPSVPID